MAGDGEIEEDPIEDGSDSQLPEPLPRPDLPTSGNVKGKVALWEIMTSSSSKTQPSNSSTVRDKMKPRTTKTKVSDHFSDILSLIHE